MESKVCTYSEKGIRLQLVKIDNAEESLLEIRLNRQVIYRTNKSLCNHFGTFGRLMFSHYIHEICINRRSNLSYMTL